MAGEIPESDTGKHVPLPRNPGGRAGDDLRREVADERAAKQELEQEVATLREAIASRDQALAIVAHDLRNPLNVIVLAANNLLQMTPDEAARGIIERILRGAQRADRLVRDLLDVSVIEGGRFSMEKVPLDTAAFVRAAVESQQSLVDHAAVSVSMDVAASLPMVDADRDRVLEIFENLIGNALKFTKAGGSIVIGADKSGRDVLFWVKDTGSGISPELMPHLFDRLHHAKRARRHGTGLDLLICMAIVEAHGGRIWAGGGLDVGTTVYFTLPAKQRLQAGEINEVASILIVDDRPENLLSLQAIPDRPDKRLVTPSSGKEALALALRERFSVALLDVSMPDMNGLEVAAHLKGLERSRDIPIIFVTAFGDDPEEIHRAYSAGGVVYLVKPLSADIVRKKVSVFVDLTRRRWSAEGARDE